MTHQDIAPYQDTQLIREFVPWFFSLSFCVLNHSTIFFNLLIDFNGMLTCLGLSYAYWLENGIHYMYISIFFVLLFLKSFFFLQELYENKYSYGIQIIHAQLYGFKYSYLIQIIWLFFLFMYFLIMLFFFSFFLCGGERSQNEDLEKTNYK